MNKRTASSGATAVTPRKTPPTAQETGAQRHQLLLKERGRSYLSLHLNNAADSARSLIKAPLSTLMTLTMIAIALALPGILYVILINAQAASDHWDDSTQISLYLEQHLPEAEGRDLAQQLSYNEQIARIEFISRKEALAEFRVLSGFGQALDQLQENPLPSVIVIHPANTYQSPEKLSLLRMQLASLDGVEEAALDLAWLRRFQAMVALTQRGVNALSCLLGLAVLLAVGNTISSAIENRRTEIQVTKLVGGSDAFVRRPFLYTGFWYGFSGGALAWLLIQLGAAYLSGPVDLLVSLYRSDFLLEGLGLLPSLLLLITSTLLGVGGAWLAVSRHIKTIEPS
jgi:cell division transport system permease protein